MPISALSSQSPSTECWSKRPDLSNHRRERTACAKAPAVKSERVTGGCLSAVALAKAEGPGEGLIYGSASVVHQLAAANLIDEYRLMVYPTILGAGKRLYPNGVASQLQLTECKQLGGGIVLLRYTAG